MLEKKENVSLNYLILKKYIGGKNLKGLEYYMKIASQIYPNVSEMVNDYFEIKKDMKAIQGG